MKNTIESLLSSESVREQIQQVKTRVQPDNVIQDLWDGINIENNLLLEHTASSLGIILYQDSFEVVNPLGSGKKKHKILAVYLTLANILLRNRSSIDQMQLVLLCRQQDFGVMEYGVTLLDGQLCKGTPCAIAGDNLGSHNIGGFTVNFCKSSYFCRYCEIDREAFQADPLAKGRDHIPQTYQKHVAAGSHNVEARDCGGVKFDSIFNELTYFHVFQPGLPPCLGHDLFEGIVSTDLALYLNHLVLKEKDFIYVELNRCINQFKYQGNDANNKPCEVNPGSGKLSGHAVQNWCFLRMLPVLIGDKIKSPGDNVVWQLILQLREIVELVCAPTISTGQAAYLRVLIDEYLYARKQTFGDHPLSKPKHHYLNHYPELIVHFGPLIRLWTLRFESKHTYFKQCARKLHNFKILCGTLAEKNQLLQSFLSAGTLFSPSAVVKKGTEFIIGDYNDKTVAHLNFDPLNTLISSLAMM